MRLTMKAILTLALLLTPELANRAAYGQNTPGGPMTIDVRNGDQNGKLLINDTDLAFESLSDGKRSRTWKYADVREVSKRGKKELRVRPYRGDRYDFQFQDRGQRDRIYDAVAQRVVAARQSTRK